MSTAKRPAFQFYPGDWLEEKGLRASSLAARGLWIDLMCFMHQGVPYGHLRNESGHALTVQEIARSVGDSPRTVAALIAELERHVVFSRNADGVIYCRRMVRDEATRTARAAGGVKSLEHPNVPPPKHPLPDPSDHPSGGSLQGSFGGSPSSSSSSSSSTDRTESEVEPSPSVGPRAKRKRHPTDRPTGSCPHCGKVGTLRWGTNTTTGERDHVFCGVQVGGCGRKEALPAPPPPPPRLNPLAVAVAHATADQVDEARALWSAVAAELRPAIGEHLWSLRWAGYDAAALLHDGDGPRLLLVGPDIAPWAQELEKLTGAFRAVGREDVGLGFVTPEDITAAREAARKVS